MVAMTRALLQASLLLCWALPLLSSTHTCPGGQYPFSCSACLSFSLHNSTYTNASEQCSGLGGRLVSLVDNTQWQTLLLYLESLMLIDRSFWVGYRLTEGGEVRGEGGESAPSVVVDSIDRSSSVTGGGGENGECVTVREGRLVMAACSEELPYICLYTYSAPHLSHSHPPLGTVHQVPTHTLSLAATITGLGITDVEWRHNKTLLATSAGVEMRANHDHSWVELRVKEYVVEVGGGSYELLVTSPAGRTVVATWSVKQAVLGSFTRAPQDLLIPEGSIAFFECSTEDSTPTPTYTWYKGENPVVPDRTRIYMSNVTHTLLIREVGEGEEGEYHCHVENSAGSMISPPATLTVRPQQEFTGSEMRFLLHPQNTTVLEGESYSMECVVLHTYPTYIYLINFTNHWLYPTASGFPTLTIENVSLAEHDGVHYACLCGPYGTYNIAFITSWPSVLNVHVRPRVHSLLTSVGNGSGPHAIPPAATLGMECKFGGVPNPVQTWYRNGEVMPEGVQSVVGGEVTSGAGSSGGSGLAVQGASAPESGVYQCHVANQHGVDISSTVLCVQALPGPTPFTVQADTTSSLYVTWSTPPSPSSHPLLLRYEIITTHTVTNHAISTGTLPPHQMWWVMEGLNVSSEYRVNVVSWSPLGKGDEGQAQSAFTFGLAPQQSPEKFLNITVSRTHQNTGLVIQWTLTLPLPPGTSLTHYQLQYRKATGEGEKGEGEGAGEMVEVESDQRWAFVDGLDDARSYEIRLRMGVQVQRSPPAYDYTPWTEWLQVEGVTTPPPTPSFTTPSQEPAGKAPMDRDSILLVAVLVPVLSVLAVAALLVPVMVGGWRLWAKRRAATYNPSKHERQHKGRQIPMGRDVFTLPAASAALGAEEEEGHDCATSLQPTVASSRPSSQSGDVIVDSPVRTQSTNAE